MKARWLPLLFVALSLAGCLAPGGTRPANQAASQASPHQQATAAYLQVADGSEQEARAAIAKLHAMCRKGEPDYDPYMGNHGENGALYMAVALFGFHPIWRGLMGELSFVCQSRSGCAILERAVPRMIALMKDDQQVEIDYLLRRLQGRSPQGSDWKSWDAWWRETGKELFKVPCGVCPVRVID